MTDGSQIDSNSSELGTSAEAPAGKLIAWASLFFALVQSNCSVIIVVSRIRTLVGMAPLAAVTAGYVQATGIHANAIRYPMMGFALVGALVNLYFVGRIRRLRAHPGSPQPEEKVAPSKLNTERLQIALSIITCLLLLAEWVAHTIIYRAA
jgi:hypothetical protein